MFYSLVWIHSLEYRWTLVSVTGLRQCWLHPSYGTTRFPPMGGCSSHLTDDAWHKWLEILLTTHPTSLPDSAGVSGLQFPCEIASSSIAFLLEMGMNVVLSERFWGLVIPRTLFCLTLHPKTLRSGFSPTSGAIVCTFIIFHHLYLKICALAVNMGHQWLALTWHASCSLHRSSMKDREMWLFFQHPSV